MNEDDFSSGEDTLLPSSSHAATSVGSSLPLPAVAELSSTMSAPDFLRRVGPLILVFKQSMRPVEVGALPMTGSGEAEPVGSEAAAYRAFSVTKRVANGHPFISVGRTRNNDLFVDDASLSRFHAFFTLQKDGRMVLRDAGSRNGTRVNGAAVPVRKAGEPVMVSSGDVVRFGSLELTAFDSPGLTHFLRTLGWRPGWL